MKANVERIDSSELSSELRNRLDDSRCTFLNSQSEIAKRVCEIIIDKLGIDEEEVTDNSSFVNDLGADSLDTVELIMQFEKEFGVTIPDYQAERISTVGEAIAFIEQNAK